MKSKLAFALFVATIFSTQRAEAGLMLSLSSPDDLANLSVGDTIVVNVEAILDAGDDVEFLAASVSYDGSLLGPPAISPAVAPAGIIPVLGDFDSSAFPDQADGIYDALFGGVGSLIPIDSSGVFFSFEVAVLAAGSSEIAFTNIQALSSLTSVNFIDIDAPALDSIEDVTVVSSLSFTSSASNVVPEPASISIWATALVGSIAVGHRRTRRRRR